MSKPWGLISDVHLHSWSAFSTVNENGVNSRVTATLDEIEHCAKEVHERGGSRIYCAGDLFHVRGKVAPSVINPTIGRLTLIRSEYGVDFHMIPGNHDLEGKDTDAVGNAVRALRPIGIQVYDAPFTVSPELKTVWVPWRQSMDLFRESLEKSAEWIVREGGYVPAYDVIIHAPVNGVIMGIPDHGFSPEELRIHGFRRVFAGHYHNHKDFGNGVYSVGALTHQTWNDVGSKAGFLIVTDESVEWRASHAPSFIDLMPGTPVEEIPLIVDGNFVRAYVEDMKEAEIKELRAQLTEWGAAGVVIHPIKTDATPARSGTTTHKASTVEESVGRYITDKKFEREADVANEAMSVLTEARAVA